MTRPGSIASDSHHAHSPLRFSHEPGLVLNPLRESENSLRNYCFGSASVEGKPRRDYQGERSCKGYAYQVKNYMNVQARLNTDIRKLYHSVFKYHPLYYESVFSAEYKRQKIADANPDADYTIAITTQGSWNRLHHIQALAETWNGPISFTLFLDDSSQMDELDSIIADSPLLK
ncbi:hypothetical protein SARC_09445, partial [Sphaeroforma arctica JP610]